MMTSLAIIFLLLFGNTVAAQERFEYEEYQMAVPVRIIFYAKDQQQADKAAQAAYQRFSELNLIMSDYDLESELMRLCKKAGETGQSVKVSDDLWRVLVKSKEICDNSKGAFDITVSPTVKLWRRAKRLHAFPEKGLLEKSQSLVGNHLWEILPETQSLRILKEGVRMDLGGIAKGDAIDQAMISLQNNGVTSALIDAGGDVRACGSPPDRDWILDISRHGQSVQKLHVENIAVASSGDWEQFLLLDGKRYSHIIDPRTGIPLTDRGAVTVIAQDAITADALASALSVLSPDEGLSLLNAYPGAEAMITREVEGEPKTWYSKGWSCVSKLSIHSW